MKIFLLIASFLLAFTGVSHAASIDADGVRKCLTSSRQVMVVPEGRTQLSAFCRNLLFPPRPRDDWSKHTRDAVVPFMPFQYGSNGKRAVALGCAEEHGKTISETTWLQLKERQARCPLFYSPVRNENGDVEVYSVIIPTPDPGDGTARGHLY